MDNINEVIEIKPEDIVDLYSTDKPDLIDITSLKAEENFDLADSTIDKLSAHSGTTDTALNSKPISVEHIKKENNITDLVSLDIVKQENNVPEENINVSSSHINLKQSKEASNEKLIDIVDLKEENDNSDENLNSTEKIVNLERENLKHKTTKIIERHHCSACNAIFNKASTLQYHISVRHKERGTREERSINKHGYRCPKCNFYSGNKGIFEGHTCSDEESSGSPVEKTTGQTSKFVIQLTSKGQVIKAYNKNKDTRAIDLPSPEKYEQEESVLIKAHFDGDLQFKAVKVQQILYKCPRCDYKTTEKRYFNRHRAAHLTPQQRQMFACAQCDNAYFTRGGLNHHIDNNHTNSSLTVDTVDLTIEDNKQEAQVQNGIEQKLELDIHDVELTSPEVNNQEEQVQNVIEQKLDLDTSAIDLPSTENNQQEKYVLIEEEFDGGLRFKQTRQTFACTLCDRILLTKKGLNNHLGINHTNSSLTVDTVDLTIEDNKQEAQVQNGIEQKLELDIDDVKLTSLEVSNQEEEQVQNSIEQKLELFIDDVELTSAEVNKQEEQVQNSVELDTRAVDLTSTEDNQQEKNVLMEEEFDDGLKYKKNRNRKRGRLQKKGYKCSTCGYRASKYFLLKRHEVVHLPLEKREMYSCLHCSKRYTQKINLIHHLIIVHPETMPERQKQIYRCSKCNFKSVKMSSLKRHRKIHLPDRQREIYCCAHCHLTYWSRKRITTHLYRLHRGCIPKARNKTLYMCSSCDFQTPHQVEFQLHRTAHGRTDKEKRSFTCPYCDKNFLGKTIFDHHLKYYRPCCTMAAAKEATSQCPTPSYQTSHKERFKEHMESHLQRAERQFYICPHCDKKYTRRGHFIDHIVLNLAGSTGIDDVELTSGSSVDSDDEPAQLRKRVYDCFKCKYQTTLIANLRRHMGVHLAREERELFACPLCDKEYTRKGGLHRHLKSCALRSRTAPQLGGLLQRFSCSKCHYETVSRGHFQRHMRSHLEERGQWFPCPYCCRKLSSKSSIDSHLIHCSLYSKIVPQRGVLHRCSKCNYQTTLIADLKRHMGVHLAREERELFACPHCHSEFARKSNLNCHLKRCPLSRKEKKKRTAPPPLPGGLYVCSKCNYQTTSVANLRRHMGVHLAREERELFACPSCHSKYTTKSSLHYHLERCPFFRPGQQPNKWYVCSKCLYQTSSRQQFRRHMRSHLERREKRWFACPHCSRKLSTKARLDYHIIHCPFNPRNTSDVAPNVEGKLELLSDTDGVELNTTEDSEQEEQDEKSAEQNIELLSDTDGVELNSTEANEQERQDEKSAEENIELLSDTDGVELNSTEANEQERQDEKSAEQNIELLSDTDGVELNSTEANEQERQDEKSAEENIELSSDIDGVELNSTEANEQEEQDEKSAEENIELLSDTDGVELNSTEANEQDEQDEKSAEENIELLSDTDGVELNSTEANEQDKQDEKSAEENIELLSDTDGVELNSTEANEQERQDEKSAEENIELLSDTDGVELNSTEANEQERQDEKSAEQNIELLSDTDEVELNTTEDSEQEEQDEKSAEQNLELTIVQEKVHQCSSCSYRTLRKGELQKHMDTHLPPEERRLFSCLYCYKKYTRKVTVKRHIELRHIGIEKNTQAKLYKCGQCEFVGRCAIHLIRHKKVHSSEKPNCTSKFGGNYPLIRHIKRRFSGLNTNDVKRNLELDIHDVELASPEVNKQEKQVQNSIEQKLELDNDDVELTSAQVSKQAEQVQNSVDSDDNDIRAVEITSMSILRSYLLSSDNKQEKHVQNREASDEIAPNIDDVKLTSVEANKGKERVQNSVESDDKPAALRKGMYDCSKCNYQTTLMANLTGHTEMHRVREERKLLLPLRNKMYRCAKCNYQTTLMASLKQHMGTHSAREERRMSARPHCDRKCTRKDNLGHHLKSCSLHSSDSHDVELITKEDSKQDEHVQSSIASGDKLELERHNVDLITADNKQEKQVQNSTELKLKLDSHDVELITKEDNKQDERVQSSIASGDKFELESHKVDLTTEDNKQEKQVQNSTELKLKLDSRDVELITKEDNKQDEHVQSSIASGDKLELERHNVDLTTADNKQEKQVQNSTELKLKLDSHDVELIIKEDNKQDERVQSSMASGDKLELERHNVDLTTEDNKQEKQVQDSTELKLKLDIDNVELTSSEANKQTERVQNSVDSDDKPVALPIRMYSCFKCNYQTTSMASLNSHRAREERQLLALRNRTYSCSRCNTYRTTSMASLHRHIATHWAPEERQSFACPHCDNKYTNKVSLEYHLQRCHLRSSDSHDVELITKEDNKQDEHVQSSVASGDKLELAKALKESQKKIYRCCTCSYQTTYKFNFSKHKKIHLAPGERQMFACLHCDKTYIQKQSLQHHLQNNHIDSRAKALKKSHKKVYRCSMCSYQTPYKSHLNTHKNTHLPPEERQRFACLHCDKTYIQKQALQWHLKYHHTDLRAKALKELQIKVYRCSTCSYQTPSKSCLNRHNNIHLPPEERQKFACLHCNKTYIQKQALQWHLKYYHTDLSLNKGAEEKVSQRNFKTRQRKNILKPPTDRPKAKKEGKYYKCSMCNARFIYEHYLLNHLEINHCERNEATTVEVIGAKDDEDGKRVQNSEASDDKLQQYNMHKRAEKIVSRRTTVSRIDSHNPKKNGDYYKCSICKALFIYERHLLKHIKSIHSERKTDDSISTTNEENTDSFIKMEIDDCAPAVGEDMHHDSQNVECPPETNVIRSEDFMQTESDEDIQDGFYDWDIVDEPEKVRIEDILKLLQPESS
ncbi:uncharacterized protein LOC115881991 isoform X7 [Sitophilus oryzae]|uniref:Uncharacterized protein LOC115881991 isoform X7 n=1 Tax=Sitophilus oryzae TaxID=7048 RepID=A0A6J2XY82_SITOR|nr:uncharacterized protein LOC115881991 isoform X7 [Sitophilus oryzae]